MTQVSVINSKRASAWLLAIMILAANLLSQTNAHPADPTPFHYSTFQCFNGNTWATGINNKGEIIGFYQASNNWQYSFVRDAEGVCHTLPNPPYSYPQYWTGYSLNGINDKGQIAGSLFRCCGVYYYPMVYADGFVSNKDGSNISWFTVGNNPFSVGVNGINNDGRMVGGASLWGTNSSSSRIVTSFKRENGNTTELPQGQILFGLNNEANPVVVGRYSNNGIYQGFISDWLGKTFRIKDIDPNLYYNAITAVNDRRQMIGVTWDGGFSSGFNYFLLQDNDTSLPMQITVPGFSRFEVRGINNRGQIVGTGSDYTKPNPTHGFIVTPTIIVVDKLEDDNSTGTLRWAIREANRDEYANTIIFDKVFPGTIFISPALGPLPSLIGAFDTIDGTGAGVVVDGSRFADGSAGLRIRGNNISVHGIKIQGFPGDGIRVDTTPDGANTVTGVVISQNVLLRNGDRGIKVSGGNNTSGNTVEATLLGNTVSESGQGGIQVLGGSGSQAGIGGNKVSFVIDSNIVTLNKRTGSDPRGVGIVVNGGKDDNVVSGRIVNNNVSQNDYHGIQVIGCGSGQTNGSRNNVVVSIESNTISENGTGFLIPASGISVSAASAGTDASCLSNYVTFDIFDNTIKGHSNGSLVISGGSGVTHNLNGVIQGNHISGSRNGGLRLSSGNAITVSGGSGFMNRIHDVYISKNIVDSFEGFGISITDGPDANYTEMDAIKIFGKNTVDGKNSGVAAAGIVVSAQSPNSKIRDVEIIDNTVINVPFNPGIVISQSTSAAAPAQLTLKEISSNSTRSNGYGIVIGENIRGAGSTTTTATRIYKNNADSNLKDGISVKSTGYVLLDNSADRNGGYGIIAPGNTDGGNNTAKNNAGCNTPGCY